MMTEMMPRRKRTGRTRKAQATERMSKDARLVDLMTEKMSKLALTDQHRSSYKRGIGVISPTHQVSNEPTRRKARIQASQGAWQNTCQVILKSLAGRNTGQLTDRWTAEAHAQGDTGKYRCQGEEQALPSEASSAYPPIPESQDQLVESQGLHIVLHMPIAFPLEHTCPCWGGNLWRS